MTDEQLIAALSNMRDLMISVATGGPRIGEVQDGFRQLHEYALKGLSDRQLSVDLPYDDLWSWHGRWSDGSLPTYRSRRVYIGDCFRPIIAAVRRAVEQTRPYEPTGWERVDRAVLAARDALSRSVHPEDYQRIGLLCREALISVAEVVWREDRHPTLDGEKPSRTDAKRRLEAFIAAELSGNANEDVRRHARSAFDLANALQHKRAADWRAAAMCVEAAATVASIMAIIAGRRAPGTS